MKQAIIKRKEKTYEDNEAISSVLNYIYRLNTNKKLPLYCYGLDTYSNIPRFNSVEEITSDYWIDIIIRMAVALTKVTLGNIRGRFTQTNALWTQDAEKMAAEGKEELQELRQFLQDNSNLIYPID